MGILAKLRSYLKNREQYQFGRSVAEDAMFIVKAIGKRELADRWRSLSTGNAVREEYDYFLQRENLTIKFRHGQDNESRIPAYFLQVYYNNDLVFSYDEYPLGYKTITTWGFIRKKKLHVFRVGSWIVELRGIVKEIQNKKMQEQENKFAPL